MAALSPENPQLKIRAAMGRGTLCHGQGRTTLCHGQGRMGRKTLCRGQNKIYKNPCFSKAFYVIMKTAIRFYGR